MAPTRAELEGALAKQYGFAEYEAFKAFFAKEFGKGMLHQLEREMTRREQETQKAPPS